MSHHQKAHGVHAEIAPHTNVLLRDISLRTVRGNPNRGSTHVSGHADVIQRAYPRDV